VGNLIPIESFQVIHSIKSHLFCFTDVPASTLSEIYTVLQLKTMKMMYDVIH